MINDIAAPEVRGGTVRDVESAFDAARTIDDITSIKASDLEITKMGDGFDIIANYHARAAVRQHQRLHRLRSETEARASRPARGLMPRGPAPRDAIVCAHRCPVDARFPHASSRSATASAIPAAAQALTHRSYGTPHNERLEFLGDGVLNCVIAALLYERFPRLPEGHLSRLRANLVNQDSLSRLAQAARPGRCTPAGRGRAQERRLPPAVDPGRRAGGVTRRSVPGRRLRCRAPRASAASYEPLVPELDPKALGKDPKTLLQELLQGRRLPPAEVQRGTRCAARRTSSSFTSSA